MHAVAKEVGNSPASVYSILTSPTPGETKIMGKVHSTTAEQ
jgi:hypothetical protein